MNRYYKLILFAILGGVLGYGYYYYVGCTSGGCPLTSKWYVTTLYGFFAGGVFGIPGKKKKEKNENKESGVL